MMEGCWRRSLMRVIMLGMGWADGSTWSVKAWFTLVLLKGLRPVNMREALEGRTDVSVPQLDRWRCNFELTRINTKLSSNYTSI
jgi:hypothetical protein